MLARLGTGASDLAEVDAPARLAEHGPSRLLGTHAVSFTDGLVVVGIGLALFALIESEKQMRLRALAMPQGGTVPG